MRHGRPREVLVPETVLGTARQAKKERARAESLLRFTTRSVEDTKDSPFAIIGRPRVNPQKQNAGKLGSTPYAPKGKTGT